MTSFLQDDLSDEMIALALAIVFQGIQPINRREIEEVIEALMVVKHWYRPTRGAVFLLKDDNLLLQDLVSLAQDQRFSKIDPMVIVDAMQHLENPLLVYEMLLMVKPGPRGHQQGSTSTVLEPMESREGSVSSGVATTAQAAQNFSAPSVDVAEYNRIRAQLGLPLPDGKVERLCYALSMIDAPKLEFALQVFDASIALQTHERPTLLESLFADDPVHLLDGRKPIRRDLLLQLKCLLFYPTWPEIGLMEHDISLMDGVIRLGLDNPRHDDLIWDISMAIRLAEQPYALLDVKQDVDAEQPSGTSADLSPGGLLSPENQRLIIDNLPHLTGPAWPRSDLERLCRALSNVGNMGLIELAAKVHQASVILAIGGRRSFVDILSRPESAELVLSVIESVLGKDTKPASRLALEINDAVALLKRWYLPIVGGPASLSTDGALMKDLVTLAQDADAQETQIAAIVDAIRRTDGPDLVRRMKLQIRWAVRIGKRGIFLRDLFAKEPRERLKFMRENNIEFQ